MKLIADIIGGALCFIIVPVVFFIYLFVLLLLVIADLIFYIFDRTDENKTRIIKKLINPLSKR